ncbi:hypothetical protein F1C12_00735 [Leifsonia shinshuensis]|uniref:Uncharacterized protein n=1 Tax=Leifsonia shinshuensis TaxID=150026 RepID=A0A7G6YG42_9MICO|nr:hypothetical protein F1C12_00735 [Leifsonia shinshuensis]
MERKTNTQENLANQKRAAELFLNRPRPGVEEIRFTQEGNRPGLGVSWSVNAVITIEGREYREILGVTGTGAPAGEPLPETPTTASPTPVTVIYSDGSSEVVG